MLWCLRVSGAGTSEANGVYYVSGTKNDAYEYASLSGFTLSRLYELATGDASWTISSLRKSGDPLYGREGDEVSGVLLQWVI